LVWKFTNFKEVDMKRFSEVVFGLALCAVALLACSRKQQARGVAAGVRTSGKVTAQVRLSAQQVQVNQPVVVSYVLENSGNTVVNVRQVQTGTGILTPLDSEWLKSRVLPGEVATVARTTLRPDSPGLKLISGKLITDRGTLEPAPASLVVNTESRTAILDSLSAVIVVSPDSLSVAQPVRVTYKLKNPTHETIDVMSIQTDSPMPMTSADPNWVNGRVLPNTEGVIAQRFGTRTVPGDWVLNAAFSTSFGLVSAQPAPLTVTQSSVPQIATGRVVGQIVISSNPVEMDDPYTIDYQLTNTRQQPVTVSMLFTDVGIFTPDSSQWRSSQVLPGATQTVVELSGTGDAPGGRVKTAGFTTSVGPVNCAPVVFTVQITRGPEGGTNIEVPAGTH
jgi:hypothetical protein